MPRTPFPLDAHGAIVRLRSAAWLLLTLACSPRTSDQPPAGALTDSGQHIAADTSRLPRKDVTVADRTRWFERLHWPNACEDDFVQTHLTDDGGLEFHMLQQGVSLVIVRCALGAYQPTSVVLLLDERQSVMSATVLRFPTFESLDGKTLAPTNTAELVGELTLLDASNALTVLSLARQIGDCGTWARYEFPGGTPVLKAFAERVSCPENAGPRASTRSGEPPVGWKVVQPN
ncbi:MAG: DUF1176 domain-containing protein [Gemmatimonadaceae bacterium]